MSSSICKKYHYSLRKTCFGRPTLPYTSTRSTFLSCTRCRLRPVLPREAQVQPDAADDIGRLDGLERKIARARGEKGVRHGLALVDGKDDDRHAG